MVIPTDVAQALAQEREERRTASARPIPSAVPLAGTGPYFLHKQGTKRCAHASLPRAQMEARRLASVTGQEFVITQEVGRVTVERPDA